MKNRPKRPPPTKKTNRDIWEVKFQQKIQQHNASAKKHNKHVVEAETQRAKESLDSANDSNRNRKMLLDRRHIQCKLCGEHIVKRSELEWFMRQSCSGTRPPNQDASSVIARPENPPSGCSLGCLEGKCARCKRFALCRLDACRGKCKSCSSCVKCKNSGVPLKQRKWPVVRTPKKGSFGPEVGEEGEEDINSAAIAAVLYGCSVGNPAGKCTRCKRCKPCRESESCHGQRITCSSCVKCRGRELSLIHI